MIEPIVTLEMLHTRHEAFNRQYTPTENSAVAYRAILARLLENRAIAEQRGWTAFVFQPMGPSGRLYLEGARPSDGARAIVPDWLGAPEPDRYEAGAGVGGGQPGHPPQ